MHDIRYNEARDEFYVTNPFAQAILTFRGGADGQEAPIRVIQGSKTKLISADTLEIDTIHNEIFVPQGDEVLVFPMMADGNVAPIRVLRGGAKAGWRTGGGIAVDPIHNLLVTDGTIEVEGQGYRTTFRLGRESILIFDRLADGDVKPLRVIRGPNTGIHAIRQTVKEGRLDRYRSNHRRRYLRTGRHLRRCLEHQRQWRCPAPLEDRREGQQRHEEAARRRPRSETQGSDRLRHAPERRFDVLLPGNFLIHPACTVWVLE